MPKRNKQLDLASSVTHLLQRCAQQADARFEAEAARVGARLTARQLVVMLAVRGRPRASQTELVALTGIDRSTLSELMKRLLAQGLVQQERAGVDRRAYAVTLTVPGDCALDLALPALASTEAAILAALAERRRAAFLTALARLLSGLERRS